VRDSCADAAFRAVIAAMKQKDRAALLKLSDPSQTRDAAKFDQQANAFFQQLQTIRLVSVPRAYELDGLVAYFGKFQSPTQTAYVPLVFTHQGDGSYLFLPMRSKQTTFNIVEGWFAPSGRGTDSPTYCTDAEVKRATHRVALAGASVWRPSTLTLTGGSLEASARPSPVSAMAAQVKSTIEQMKSAVRGADISGLYEHMTPEGASRLRKWYETAQPQEREQYKAALIDQQPFFVFDESPLVVVYTKTKLSGVQVLYFTATADQRLLWTNSAHITDSDQVFKRGPLVAAASAATPFSTMVIK